MSQFLGFLRAELAPTPGRARATARVVVMSLVAVLFVMTVRMPEAYWVLIMIFGVALPDAGASLRQGIDRVLGTIAGGAAGLVAVMLGADQPWLVAPLAGVLAALGVHCQRNTRLPYAGGLAGLTAIIVLTGPSTPDGAVAVALWRTAAATLGVGLGTAAQLLLWPADPAELLLDDLARRLETAAAQLAGEGPAGVAADLPTGLARQLDLLANAETRHPGLRRRHVEQLALIGLAERVLTGVLVLPAPADVPTLLRVRVRAVRDGCLAAASALRERRPLAIGPLVPAGVDEAGGTVAPAVVELEQAVASLPAATAFLARDREPAGPAHAADAIAAPALLMPGFFAPRPADATAAVATGVACALCLVLVRVVVWPGIHTAALTCVVVAQSTLGASVRKAGLRIGGALLGAALALVTIVGAMPFMVTIASLLVVMAPGVAIAAWINVGSARINYAGYQTLLAYGLGLAAGWGPSTDLVTLRDRAIGICVGIVVSAAVHLTLGAARAEDLLGDELRATMRALARLTRVGVGPRVER
jgi:multidrug resistance protein MdtO